MYLPGTLIFMEVLSFARMRLKFIINLYYYLLEIPHCFVLLVKTLLDFQDYCGFIFMCIVLRTLQ